MRSDDLIAVIAAFLATPGVDMTESTFGRLAVNDGKFVTRIRSGGRVWPETEEKVRNFIASYQPKSNPPSLSAPHGVAV